MLSLLVILQLNLVDEKVGLDAKKKVFLMGTGESAAHGCKNT